MTLVATIGYIHPSFFPFSRWFQSLVSHFSIFSFVFIVLKGKTKINRLWIKMWWKSFLLFATIQVEDETVSVRVCQRRQISLLIVFTLSQRLLFVVRLLRFWLCVLLTSVGWPILIHPSDGWRPRFDRKKRAHYITPMHAFSIIKDPPFHWPPFFFTLPTISNALDSHFQFLNVNLSFKFQKYLAPNQQFSRLISPPSRPRSRVTFRNNLKISTKTCQCRKGVANQSIVKWALIFKKCINH